MTSVVGSGSCGPEGSPVVETVPPDPPDPPVVPVDCPVVVTVPVVVPLPELLFVDVPDPSLDELVPLPGQLSQ
jgi:hypothetical protein